MPRQRMATAASPPRQQDTNRPSHTSSDERERCTIALLERAAECRGRERQELLDEAVLLNGSVAEAIANRYRARGIDSDDLLQVAYLGLVKAAQGYRAGEGPGFFAYAVPTISGEIKRHFRDFGWMVRPPRRIQELRSAAISARSELTQERGRPPTHEEVAGVLGVAQEELVEAELADRCFHTLSLDAPGPIEGAPVLADLLVDGSDDFEHVEDMTLLRPALRSLCDRDQRILMLRFVRGCTQEEIGAEIGVSQMQVSRLLTRILRDLRRELSDAHECGSEPDRDRPA